MMAYLLSLLMSPMLTPMERQVIRQYIRERTANFCEAHLIADIPEDLDKLDRELEARGE